MGLIKTGVKYGTLFVVAREGMKAYENHKQSKTQQQQQPQSIQQGPYYQQPPQQQPQPRNASDCFHQAWCNGQCGGQCNATTTIRNVGTEATRSQKEYDEKPPAY